MWKVRELPKFLATFLVTSTIHGNKHLAAPKRHFSEHLLWISLIIGCIYASINLSGFFLTRYWENPTVISMERDKFSWNTSFPTATICPTTKLNPDLLNKYVQNSSARNKTALREFIMTLSHASYDNFESVVNYPEIRPEMYMDLLLRLQFAFNYSVSSSGVNGSNFKMEQFISEMGICYSFNSRLAIYNNPGYWKQNRWEILPEKEAFYVNPLDGEVFANIVNMSTGYELYFHGPYDVADVASKAISSLDGYFLQVYLTALSLYSTTRTRILSIKQRKCRFYDENNLKRSPVYSYVLCRMDCRADLAKKYCGCIPHFYRRQEGERVCSVQGLHCLARHKDLLISLKRKCDCYSNCEEVNYAIQNSDSRKWFLGSNLQWGLKEYPRMRLKRDVIFGFTDVLVYIGGMTGFFFGCSLLSFIEIAYFFSLRLFWFCKNMQPGN